MVQKLYQQGITSNRILQAFSSVPRHLFISEALHYRAYELTSLPIGFGQTISSPLTIGRVLQAAGLYGDEEVLEIGTGSGYQSALLAEITGNVDTQERIEHLYNRSRTILYFDLNYCNISINHAESFNYKKQFDAIIVAAGATTLPQELLNLLKHKGRLIIPLENVSTQKMLKYTKLTDENIVEEELGDASFVPLIRQH